MQTGDQHIIVCNAGPFDNPFFPNAAVWIGYTTLRYADDHLIKVSAADLRTWITLIQGAIILDSNSILYGTSESPAGIVLSERRSQIQRQYFE